MLVIYHSELCCVIIIIINVRFCLDQLISFKTRLTILQEVANEMRERNKMRRTNEESEVTHHSPPLVMTLKQF